ncbi:hypothetical protein BV898_14341 [Hypsibius exemplaris]|uniref:Uncharacterized protein n=1 Tax=Hypsibius exemplaris TaxID=2072580 RepID=A0A9X6RJC4_HYPEX|nr:hypothetical protein BV898_14341 [Hypsibius exemplaris]
MYHLDTAICKFGSSRSRSFAALIFVYQGSSASHGSQGSSVLELPAPLAGLTSGENSSAYRLIRQVEHIKLRRIHTLAPHVRHEVARNGQHLSMLIHSDMNFFGLAFVIKQFPNVTHCRIRAYTLPQSLETIRAQRDSMVDCVAFGFRIITALEAANANSRACTVEIESSSVNFFRRTEPAGARVD